jgi:hypothetical protein
MAPGRDQLREIFQHGNETSRFVKCSEFANICTTNSFSRGAQHHLSFCVDVNGKVKAKLSLC